MKQAGRLSDPMVGAQLASSGLTALSLTVLLLLLTAPWVQRQQALEHPDLDQVIWIDLASNGDLFLNDELVEPEQLAHRLRRLVRAPDQPVLVLGDAAPLADRMLAISSAVALAGLTDVTVIRPQTRPTGEEAAAPGRSTRRGGPDG